MFNIRYGIKFMTEHVVFMGAADTSNNIMHFGLKGKKRRKTGNSDKKNRSIHTEYDVLFASTVVCVYLFL